MAEKLEKSKFFFEKNNFFRTNEAELWLCTFNCVDKGPIISFYWEALTQYLKLKKKFTLTDLVGF
jgi:hypothetical protein